MSWSIDYNLESLQINYLMGYVTFWKQAKISYWG